jgi:hypothetical protein
MCTTFRQGGGKQDCNGCSYAQHWISLLKVVLNQFNSKTEANTTQG